MKNTSAPSDSAGVGHQSTRAEHEEGRREGLRDARTRIRYTEERHRELSEALERAYRLYAERVSCGEETLEVQGEILRIKRRLREGGRLRAGDLLAEGRYLLEEISGRGGFATVWKAYDRKMRRIVAVKVLHGQYARDRSRRERFMRGARKMAELRHPGIVQVFESELEDGGYHFFVMEYLAGGTLHEAILAGRFEADHRLKVLLQLGEALEFAHSRGIIHRDIKPQNVLLDLEGQPKLTDFDLVRAFDTTGGTRTGMMGTVVYAAPEAMLQAQTASRAADVYSLGMTAIFVLSGKDLPLDALRQAERYVETLTLTERMKGVVQRAVNWYPSMRFDSIEEFCRALRDANGDLEPTSKQPETARRVLFPYPDTVGEGKEPEEIPFKIFVLADFGLPYELSIAERPRIRVDQQTFAAALAEHPIELELEVLDLLSGTPGASLTVRLRLDSLDSFTPEVLVRSHPILANAAAHAEESKEVERRLVKQLHEILSHERFQQLESTWRGLAFLVERCDFSRPIFIDLLQVSKEELSRDVHDWRAVPSGLCHHLRQQLFDRATDGPVAVMLGDYEFLNEPSDLELLRNMAGIGESFKSIFMSSVQHRFFGVQSLEDLALTPDLTALFDQDTFATWSTLREEKESRSLCLVQPRYFLRPAHRWGDHGAQCDDGLLGNSAFALASVLSRSVADTGALNRIEGPRTGGLVENLNLVEGTTDINTRGAQAATELLVPMRRTLEFGKLGFIAFSGFKNHPRACFFKVKNIMKPREYIGSNAELATEVSRFEAQMSFVLTLYRVVHVLGYVGSSRDDFEHILSYLKEEGVMRLIPSPLFSEFELGFSWESKQGWVSWIVGGGTPVIRFTYSLGAEVRSPNG